MASPLEPRPVIPAEVTLPEITVNAVIVSVVLAAVLAGANAYLGQFAGMPESASIPAAVITMAVRRLFRESNILENNMVETAASSGEALAAGVIFTIPALLLIGYWKSFDYGQTAAIASVGGLLGVLFTIPLRRVLIVTERLRYPEGIATAEVLKVGSGGGTAVAGFRTLLSAAIIGGLFKLGESGLRLWAEALEGAVRVGRSVVYGGVNLSPALLAVGFIIGPNTASVVFLGGALGWLVLLPLYGAWAGAPENVAAIEAAKSIGSTPIRYVGIGAMLGGGLLTPVPPRPPFVGGVRRRGVSLFRRGRLHGGTRGQLKQSRVRGDDRDDRADGLGAGAGDGGRPSGRAGSSAPDRRGRVLRGGDGWGQPAGPQDGLCRGIHAVEAANHASGRGGDCRGGDRAGAGAAAGQVRHRRGDSGSSPSLERAAGHAHGQPGARRVRGHAPVGVGRLGRGHWDRHHSGGPSAGGARL